MSAIQVSQLRKEYRVHEKKEGLLGSVQGFFHRQYRTVEAVKGISFSIELGEMVGFIGPNGAGKTTTLKMLSGLLYPSNGDAKVLGFTPWERNNEYLRKIGFVMGQRNQLWWDIPTYDSFLLNRDIYEIEEKTFRRKVDELAQMLDVVDLLHVPVRNLSLGERMKMEIISALLHAPQIFYLDEPTIGLDLTSQKKLRSFFAEYNRKYNITMILTSHYMADIVSLCDRIIVINDGSIVYDGDLEAIRDLTEGDKIVKIHFPEQPDLRVLKAMNMEIKDQKDNQFVFGVKRTELQQVLNKLNEWCPIDFSVEDQPIEDVIESIYAKGVSSGEREEIRNCL